MADNEFPPEISEAIRSAALEQFGGIVAAAVDEQMRARIPVIEAAIRADERRKIRQLAIRTRAACYGVGGHPLADLLGPAAAGTGPGHG